MFRLLFFQIYETLCAAFPRIMAFLSLSTVIVPKKKNKVNTLSVDIWDSVNYPKENREISPVFIPFCKNMRFFTQKEEVFMIQADFHTHTNFSDDSQASAQMQLDAALEHGLTSLCFTDHEDYAYPTGEFQLNVPEYTKTMETLRDAYAGRIQIAIGMEAGLRPDYVNEITSVVSSYPFDFVIGSTHVVRGQDPYVASYWQGRTEKESIRLYLEETLANIRCFDCFDVYGHIDYVIRYVPSGHTSYSYIEYCDILDEILRLLIAKGKGIECNTGGFKYGLGHPNPHEDLIRRYVELGGEILTIGSDAHAPQHIAYDFHRLPDLLAACGVRYYTTFLGRKPIFHRL